MTTLIVNTDHSIRSKELSPTELQSWTDGKFSHKVLISNWFGIQNPESWRFNSTDANLDGLRGEFNVNAFQVKDDENFVIRPGKS